jgi:hypothetical protein
VCSERRGLGVVGEIAEEAQLTRSEGELQAMQKQAAKQSREHAHRQEEAGPASDPAFAVERRPATRHHAMDVRMVLQGLAPGVKDGGHAELGAEMLGVGSDGGERLGRRAEQDRVDNGLVLEGDLADRRRQGEHDVEVGYRQQFGLPLREPPGGASPWHLGQ